LFFKTQKDYILEYVSRIDGLLEASLSREALADEDKFCQQCDQGNWAVWRCCDCAIEIPMCRGCIRLRHNENPFHRIEHWNGNFFRPAELWEVGAYLTVRHRNRMLPCNRIRTQIEFLEKLERRTDRTEQLELNQTNAQPTNSAAPSSTSTASATPRNNDAPPSSGVLPDNDDDEDFLRYLDDLRDMDVHDSGEDKDDEGDGEVDDDMEEDELDGPFLNYTLPSEPDRENLRDPQIPSAQRTMGTHVRVVHTNGIHNIAMIGCECQGPEEFPNDLVAARLMPTSFERIRTLFSGQLLDYFRMSNLETKSSAYQFYHLLQRLTNPMDPGAVVNLYREFRRMGRIWRWMKRLKWAGYGNKDKMASDVAPGELSVFCPACPQPGINIPDNWKDDPARYAYYHY
jgi:hypothetical protein